MENAKLRYVAGNDLLNIIVTFAFCTLHFAFIGFRVLGA